MRYIIADTEDGVVVRCIGPHGESAWRRNTDGSIDRCLDHKGPWLRHQGDLPAEVQRQVDDHAKAGMAFTRP